MKKNKFTFVALLSSVSLLTACSLFANMDAHKTLTQLRAGDPQTYQYIKTDFSL